MTGATCHGLFWILFDPYQSQNDKHSLEAFQTSENNKEGELKWTGRTFKRSDNIRKLKTVFRMTASNFEHITETIFCPSFQMKRIYAKKSVNIVNNLITTNCCNL